ncbi:uncharacterized protein UMAG_06146 [Mycosarcoma maydis]|uniref:Uncharacterized protein n=1 Tax=Mycosarcoma maydis TaxID=5270 RepID=A0A0D1DNY1_MYCMD|nr:uncharacterized protein UMAG_06146 [Ustilago maydis 521]KIS65766.1 hypothetical protein UMAG_06146 [Ustilago maydis 521]|eukprot:XP_011392528.1 hypothetical protein UMAG_06146 [Ustilago maydis 521]
MRIITLFSAVFGAFFITTVHAAPAQQLDQQRTRLLCDWDNKYHHSHLFAGDYNYGNIVGAPKLGYKSFTEDGKDVLRVVKIDPDDSTIKPLAPIEVSCNSTALNYFSHQGEFGKNTPVKLLADVGRDGVPFCIGIRDPTSNPTDIVLVPLSDFDDESQANQFWMSQFKYNNLLPLVGKSNTSENVEHNNTWPILAPTDDAKQMGYRAGYSEDKATYVSFA